MSAVASLGIQIFIAIFTCCSIYDYVGMILLWNVDEGFNQIDKYFHQNDENIKAGACLGVGIVSSGVRNESDPALAILSDYLIDSSSHLVRLSSIIGLGIAYAGAAFNF